jgi:putative ABC transport system permease protein
VRALALGAPRFTSGLLTSFSVLALLLMAVGIYGLIAFSTTQRLPEIGVRVALGADRAAIVQTVLRQALALAVAGLALGALAAALVARYLEGQFFGVNSLDPITWSAVSALIFLVVLGASWRPARQAAGVDPAVVLRRV